MDLRWLTETLQLAAPLETIGLFGFAWTSLGPPHVHWIAPLIFSSLIAIANVSHPINLAHVSVIKKTGAKKPLRCCSFVFIWLQSTI